MLNNFAIFLAIAFCLMISGCSSQTNSEHASGPAKICPPCDHHHAFDGEAYEGPGKCPVCGMALIQPPDFSAVDVVKLHAGSGNFVISGGSGIADRTIPVFYYQPKAFNQDSKVLIVVPGTGRNAWDYRDAWIKAADQYNVLVLAPHYSEEYYQFADYHLGGVVANLKINSDAENGDNRFRLDDADIEYQINTDRTQWLYPDFDRLFALVKNATGLQAEGYDLFGHSAGAQILHRLVLLHSDSSADRVVAANAGFYTLPNMQKTFFYGVSGTGIEEAELVNSFSNKLVIMLGKKDDASASGGRMLHTPMVDEQGKGRLERGRYFYQVAKFTANTLLVDFNWELVEVPGVGHDFKAISKAAADYLYR